MELLVYLGTSTRSTMHSRLSILRNFGQRKFKVQIKMIVLCGKIRFMSHPYHCLSLFLIPIDLGWRVQSKK